MGYEQISGMTDFHFVDWSGGKVAAKNRRDTPGAFFTTGNVPQSLINAFVDCQHVVWYGGNLRKWFGYDAVNTTAANTGAAGLGIGAADWRAELTHFGIWGNKFYEVASNGALTDRSGANVVDTSQAYCIKTHIQGTNRYVIAGNGVQMWRWNGGGNNIAALGGTPFCYQSFDYYGDRWWGVKNADSWNLIYASDFTDPESNWNASSQVIIPVKDTPYGCINVGSWLAVLCRNSIASFQGYGESSFSKDEQVVQIGSSAHRTLSRGQCFDPNYGWVDGFFFVSWQGPIFVSDAKRVYKLGLGIFDEWNETDGLNKDLLNLACGVYVPQWKQYVFAVPWGADLGCTRLYAVDVSSPMVVSDQITYPIWPMPSIVGSSNYVTDLQVVRDTTETEWLYMQDSSGYHYKFDPDLAHYDPKNVNAGIESHGQSKVYDLGTTYEMREPIMMAKASGDWNVATFFKFDDESGDGTYGNTNLASDADVLTTSFTLGSSTLGGKTYVHDVIEGITGWGQLLQYKFQNYTKDQSFSIEELILWMKALRKASKRTL